MTVRKYTSRSQQTTLSAAVTSGATVIPVSNASALLAGTTLSAGQTFTVVIDPDTALEEIVDIYSASGNPVSGNNLTVVRAVDMSGASAQDHSSGAVIRHMIIGRDLRESNLHIEATGSYNDGTGAHDLHGLGSSDGVVVGTDKAQTLTNKTLTSPILTGAGVEASIIFEGATPDAFETTLAVVDPTQDNTITLPNTTGTVVLATATQTLTDKTLTSPIISGSPVITGLSSAGMSASSAAPKDYVDAILGSATAAATSAASAATSASSAATSASSAATTYDNFDDRYLGDKASAPTVDNDGNTLLIGAIYWNSTLNAMYVWSGTAWVQIAISTAYTAPTLGSTTIAGGTTYTNVDGLTINSTTIPTSATLVKTTDNLSVLASTTSAQLEALISDNTGSGSLVFSGSPVLTTPTIATVNSAANTSNAQLYNSQTSGTLSMGNGGSRTGIVEIANATTLSHTVAIANGITATGNTKAVNIGTAGAAGSTTNIALGGTAGTSNITLNGNLTATPAQGTVTTASTGVGYMGIPASSAAATGAYTIVAADAGEHIYSTATRTITIPANGTTAFPIGTTITFIAATGATVTIAITTDTLLLAGAGTTGSRTLAPFGMATAVKITATSWIISGNGLS